MDLTKLSQIQVELEGKKEPSHRVSDSRSGRSVFGGDSRNISLRRVTDSKRLKPLHLTIEPAKKPKTTKIVDTKKPAYQTPAMTEKVQKIVDSLKEKIEDSVILELFNSSRQTRRSVLENLNPSCRRKVLDSLKNVKQIIDDEDLEAEVMPDISMSMAAEDITDYLTNGTEEFVEKIDFMPQPLQPLCVELVGTEPKTEERSVILHKIADLFKENSIKFVVDSQMENFLESDNLGDGAEVHDQAPLEVFGSALLDLAETGDIEAFVSTIDENGLLGDQQTTSEDDVTLDLTDEEADNMTEDQLSDEEDKPTLDSLRLTRYAIKNHKVTDSLKSFMMKRNIIIDSQMDELVCAEEPYHCPEMSAEEYHTAVLLPKINLMARMMWGMGSRGYYDGQPESVEFDGNFIYATNQLGGVKVYVPVGEIVSQLQPGVAVDPKQFMDTVYQNLVSFDEMRNIAQTIGEEDICNFAVYKKNPFRGEWCK